MLILKKRTLIRDPMPKSRFTIKHDDSDDFTFVFETPPTMRKIAFASGAGAGSGYCRDGKIHTFLLRVPWSYFLARMRRLGMSPDIVEASFLVFSERRIKSVDQAGVCFAPLPNMIVNDRPRVDICDGSGAPSRGRGAAEKLAHLFWSSIFNGEIGIVDRILPKEITSSRWILTLKKWQTLSKSRTANIHWKPVKILRRSYPTLRAVSEIACD